jgi:hypothetical protein
MLREECGSFVPPHLAHAQLKAERFPHATQQDVHSPCHDILFRNQHLSSTSPIWVDERQSIAAAAEQLPDLAV